MTQPHYVLNEPAVASQLIDGETILIHFDRGRYYSTTGLGSELLQRILEQHPTEGLAELLATQFSVDPRVAAESVSHFVDTLRSEGLIVASDRPGAAAPTSLGAHFTSGAFEPLVLEVHSELEDLLRLDPLHDVDDTGWPSVGANAP